MISYDFTKKAKKQLNKFSVDVQQRIIKKINHYCLQTDPLNFAKHLTTVSGSFYRFQIGDYRIIFILENQCILFIAVEHRSRIYQRQWNLRLTI